MEDSMARFHPLQRHGELAIAVILFLVGLVWLVGVLDMPKGEFSVPGPGFFPGLLGLALCVTSVALAGKVFATKTTLRVPVGNWHIWSTGIALVVLALLFEPLGFVPSIALFIAFFLRRLAEARWTTCILAATAAAGAAYWFFSHLLGVPLPPVRWL
jgi:hypothetical protein